MTLIHKMGYSLRVFNRASQIAKYCDRKNDGEFICQTVDWILTNPVIGVVTVAMSAGEAPATIVKAIQSNRPLKMRAVVS